MPRRLAIVLIAVTTVLVPVALAWAKQGPSRATQIRTAVGQAESSSDTWATVNICDTGAHPNSIGIRAQMPSLGVDAQLSMVFEVEYYSATAGVYKPVPGSTVSVPLGSSTLGLRQSGFTLPLTPHAGTLRGVVTVQWSVGGQLVGSATRVTTAGHPDADYGDPGGYSSSVCVMR
jgi:hypothetical protein